MLCGGAGRSPTKPVTSPRGNGRTRAASALALRCEFSTMSSPFFDGGDDGRTLEGELEGDSGMCDTAGLTCELKFHALTLGSSGGGVLLLGEVSWRWLGTERI